MKSNIRLTHYALFTFSLFLLACSLILQYAFHYQPCPLCIIDRIIVIAFVILFGVALWHRPLARGQKIYSGLGFLLAVFGIISTARHLWLIHLPPLEVPSCSPDFNYLIETFPLKEALVIILKSSGECAENNQPLLGLSLPGWTLLAFIFLAIGSLVLGWLALKRNNTQPKA